MAPLSPASARAVARLRAYRPPPTVYASLPLSRRAAVLLLLYPDRHGALRIVLTLRSANLTSYAGQVSLPGGKADALAETPWQTARREAAEEIGLPEPDAPRDRQLPAPFRVEHLCELPLHLALTEMGVRPCVALLHSGHQPAEDASDVEAEERLIPRLGDGEVAALFTAPFERFLSRELGDGADDAKSKKKTLPWYRGNWSSWNDSTWRMHDFRLPRHLGGAAYKRPAAPLPVEAGAEGGTKEKQPAIVDEEPFRIWGLTASILVAAARIAYGRDPDFPCREDVGEEDMITRLLDVGRLPEAKAKGGRITRDDLKRVGEKGKM